MPVQRPQSNRPTRGDVLAAVSVALVLIPQSLAYAELAGLPPHRGLFAAAFPTIAAALFASSRYLQTGPVAMTSLLTFGALAPMAGVGTEQYVALAALLALVVGVSRIIVGVIKAGWIAYLMSQPVLMGFTTAAAILIVFTQMPRAFGIAAVPGDLIEGVRYTATHAGQWEPASVILSVITIALVLGGRAIHRLFPGVLVAVIIGLGFSVLSDYPGATVGSIPQTLPPVDIVLPWSALPVLLLPGAVIALVGFAEAAAISRAFATRDREEWNPDREFIGQGAANVVAGFMGAFPVGGSFSRSSINRLTGGHTRWSGAITGVLVLSFLPFAGILAPLPRAVLAGIIIGAVANLIQLPALVRLLRYSRLQALVGWITFAATLALAPRVDRAVLLGIALSVIIHLYRESTLRVSASFDGRALRLVPHGVLYFGSAPSLDITFMHELSEHPDAVEVIVDLGSLGRIDYTGAVVLKRVVENARDAGLSVRLTNAPPHAARILTGVFGPDDETHPEGEHAKT